MIWLAGLSLFCAAVPALLFLSNLGILRLPPSGDSSGQNAAVLIPARDEEANIEGTLRAAIGSGAAEILVLDDGSTDRTAEIVRQIAREHPVVRLLAGAPLPAGWCGKNFACAQLAAAATQSVLIFIDADVQLESGAAGRLSGFLNQAGAQLASGVPREVTETFSEQLLIPLIHFLLFGFLPLGRMRRLQNPAYGAGCGQLFVAEAAAYRAAGGHGAIRNRIHEGLALPKEFRKRGFRTDLFDATEVAACRMYRFDGDVWRGLAKNTHEGLGAPAVILPMTTILLLGQVVPFVLFFTATSATLRVMAGAAVLLALLPRAVALKRFQHPLVSALLHPVGILAVLAIQWFGLVRFLFGRPAKWKGRAYSPGRL